jgi:hypothetical protein
MHSANLKLGALFFAFACLFGPMGALGVAAAAVEKGQVHFEPFEFPGPTSSKSVYFTLFINPTKQRYLLDLCKKEPRVREAVYKLLSGRDNLHTWGLQNPLLKKASDELKKRINKAVEKFMVSEAYLVRGNIMLEQETDEVSYIPNPWSCKTVWDKAIQDAVAE